MKPNLLTIGLAVFGAVVLPQTALADPNCTCRAGGQNFQIGEIACIRGRLAQCQMNQNNPSWQPISDTCPQARASPQPERFASLPGLSAARSSLPSSN